MILNDLEPKWLRKNMCAKAEKQRRNQSAVIARENDDFATLIASFACFWTSTLA